MAEANVCPSKEQKQLVAKTRVTRSKQTHHYYCVRGEVEVKHLRFILFHGNDTPVMPDLVENH